jgi:nitrogen regulatory protein PII
MHKMVMIVYNEAIDNEVMEILDSCPVKNYTLVSAAFGRGTTSGTHRGDDVWPGRNNILYAACDEKQAQEMLLSVKELKKTLGHEGIKVFVLPIDAMV